MGATKLTWAKNGTPLTLGSELDDLDITDLTSLKFNQFLIHKLATGSGHVDVTFNDTGGTAYAGRSNAGSETTYTSDAFFRIDDNGGVDGFGIIYAIGIAVQEKLAIVNWISANTAGASNAPTRYESVFKWSDTSNTIDRIDIHNPSTGGYVTSSNISALGTD